MKILNKRLKKTPIIASCLVGVIFFVLSFSVVYLIKTHYAHAASVTNFIPGRIIDDAVFTNADSMNVAQIQAFLDSKVPVCDNWGTNGSTPTSRRDYVLSKGYALPMKCLKEYTENGLTAAQIIYNVSQQYQINPQVLIVLLQKEQGLVTDDWPTEQQYRSATGYGCPDTAPCDSQYYGLTNQITWSGKMFRAIMDNRPTWYTPYVLGDNSIQYSPSASCGSSIINIQNRATQALYNYTPYQPNQDALNAGWGTAPCGAYGNRNFYLYFTEWFGNVHYLFGNIPSQMSLYAKQPCTIDAFDGTAIGRLYNPDTRDFLYTTSSSEACTAVNYGYIWDGVVMKNATGPDAIPVYRISNSERHLYTSSETIRNQYLNSFGYKDEGISFYVYSAAADGRVQLHELQHDETSFLTSSGREAVYYMSEYRFKDTNAVLYTDSIDTGKVSVYRLTRNNTRLYTINPVEKERAIASYGFQDEGIVSTNDSGPNDANMPVYRLRSPTGGYVYTTDRVERDYAIINYNHMSEEIAFYGLLYSDAPVYRATDYNNLMRIFTNNDFEYRNAASSYNYTLEGIGWYGYSQ